MHGTTLTALPLLLPAPAPAASSWRARPRSPSWRRCSGCTCCCRATAACCSSSALPCCWPSAKRWAQPRVRSATCCGDTWLWGALGAPADSCVPPACSACVPAYTPPPTPPTPTPPVPLPTPACRPRGDRGPHRAGQRGGAARAFPGSAGRAARLLPGRRRRAPAAGGRQGGCRRQAGVCDANVTLPRQAGQGHLMLISPAAAF